MSACLHKKGQCKRPRHCNVWISVKKKHSARYKKKKKRKNIVIVRRVSDFFFVNISASRLLNNGFTEWNRASCVRSNRKLKLSSPQVRATKFTQ